MGRKSYVEHTAVTVQDIDWSVRFFVQVFGMSVTRQKENHGHLSQVWLDGGIQLVASPDDPAVGRPHHLGIVVQDFSAVRRDMLRWEGVHPMEGKPEKWLQLPDGLVLEKGNRGRGSFGSTDSVSMNPGHYGCLSPSSPDK